MATGSADATTRLWAMPTGQLIAALPHNGKILALTFAGDSSLLVTGSADQTVKMWSVPDAREVLLLRDKSPISGVALGIHVKRDTV